jgi:EH domain-containing protein 3/lysosomal acid phosphatase
LQLIAVKKPCPRNEQELQKAYRSSMIAELNHDNEDLYSYLTTHTGQNVTNITAVEFLYNTLQIEASSCNNTKQSSL